MDAIRFETQSIDTPADGYTDSVRTFINGRDLVDLAKEVELPFASRGDGPDRAGSYTGLPAGAVFLPSRRLFGEPEDRWDDWDGRISVLGCGCGAVGCWPLQVRIRAREDVVVWDDFAQPHRRRWKYHALGPFVFDREEYGAALRGARASRM